MFIYDAPSIYSLCVSVCMKAQSQYSDCELFCRGVVFQSDAVLQIGDSTDWLQSEGGVMRSQH